MLGYDVRRDADLGDATALPTALVIASHGGPEAEIIRTALDNGVGYIGLVASKVRGASILNELELSEAERARIHTPVGLPIGAKTPAEIAVSITAELVAGIRGGGLTRAVIPRRRPAGGGRPGVRHDGDGRARHRAPAAGRHGLLVLRPGLPHGVREPARRRMTAPRVTGVVLAAGNSRRLGTPKQLLPYRDTTLLGATLDVARSAGFDQLIVTLGGVAQAVRDAVPLDGADVVTLDALRDDSGADGCSASLRAALGRVDPRAAGIVLMLGDQPQRESRDRAANDRPGAVWRHRGVPLRRWHRASVLVEPQRIQRTRPTARRQGGLEAGGIGPASRCANSRWADRFRLDVDTWDDYRRLLESVPS